MAYPCTNTSIFYINTKVPGLIILLSCKTKVQVANKELVDKVLIIGLSWYWNISQR